jgi:hypothetical protein
MTGSVGGAIAVAGDAGSGTGWVSAVIRTADLVLRRPSLWPIALVGFLARGGFVLLLVPILPIPTAVGIANSLGPTAVTAAGLPPATITLLMTLGIATVAWFVLGGIVGAVADIVLVEVAEGEGTEARAPSSRSGTRALVIRLVGIRVVSLIPLAIAITLTARPIFDALYRQLTAPSQVVEPLLVRIVMDAAGSFVVVGVGWFIGELIGGIAVRLAILGDLSLGRAVIGAVIHIVRRPLTTAATAVLGSAGLLLTLGPSLIATGFTWDRLHGLVRLAQPIEQGLQVKADATDLSFVVVSLVIVATWLATLVFASVGSAWRSLLWSNEVERAVTTHR